MNEPVGYRKPPTHIRTFGDVIRLCCSMFPDTGYSQRFKFVVEEVPLGSGTMERLFFINDYGQQVLICPVDLPLLCRGPYAGELSVRWEKVLRRCYDEMVRLTDKMEAAIAEAKKRESA